MDLTSLTHIPSLLAHWPTDWIIVGAVTVFIAFDTLRSGGTRASALALALPATVLILEAVPHASGIGALAQRLSTPVLQVLLFVALFVALYILTYRIIGFFSAASGGPVQALFCGLGATAILMAVWVSMPELSALWHFGPQVQAVFSEPYRFWWLLGGYGAIAFARG